MIKFFTAIFLSLTLLLAVPVAAQQKIHTTAFSITPDMDSQDTVNKIRTTLKFVKGVKEVKADTEHQIVVVVYDSTRTKPEAIIEAIAEVGHTAAIVKPDDCTDCPSNN